LNIKNLANIKIGKKEKYPEKTSVNLLFKEKEYTDPKYQIIIFVIFLIILGVFVKFMVIDLITDATKAQNDYSNMQSNISQLQENNKDYAKIRKEYSKYGNGYLNDDEKSEVDRATIMSVINDNISTDITSIDISGNVAKVTVDGVSLKTVSSIVSDIEDSSSVSYVNVSTAGSGTSGNAVTATLSVTFKSAGGDK
jgi:hypothetical protein